MDGTGAMSTDVTMADIAQLAGVSESTVSRALSGSPLIGKQTRERVLRVARDANYTVNINARNLRQKQTRTIEVNIPLAKEYGRQHMSDPFYLDMLGVIADALSERHYDLLLTKRAPWAEGMGASSIQSGRADGIIIMGQGQDLASLRTFTSLYSQVVVWGAHLREDNYVVVGTDNVAGGKIATEHLMRLGRRRIAFLGDIAEPEIRLRREGYRRALENSPLGFDPDLVFSAPFDGNEARVAAARMVNSGVSFDSIFCASDVIAMSAINALRHEGLRVPDDVAIVGYDDITIAANFDPSITTVSQQIQQGGRIMVDLLLKAIAAEPIETTLLPVRLKVRESCGAPASGISQFE